jgi:hypothetical protein
VVHTYNPSTWEAEVRRSQVLGQPDYRERSCHKNKKQNNIKRKAKKKNKNLKMKRVSLLNLRKYSCPLVSMGDWCQDWLGYQNPKILALIQRHIMCIQPGHSLCIL